MLSSYNTLRRLFEEAKKAYYDIPGYRKKRENLITELYSIVERYASHEQSTHFQVTEMENTGKAKSAIDFANMTRNYPELRANELFQTNQENLAQIEEELRKSTEIYNGHVKSFNQYRGQLPHALWVGLIGFGRDMEYSGADDDADGPLVVEMEPDTEQLQKLLGTTGKALADGSRKVARGGVETVRAISSKTEGIRAHSKTMIATQGARLVESAKKGARNLDKRKEEQGANGKDSGAGK